MLTYNVDFLSQSIKQEDPREMMGSNITEMFRTEPSLPPLDRSTGSPDSLRSETSSESPDSITDMLLSLQKQADVISKEVSVETEKPKHSYIALISMAILNSKDKKMVLGEIYESIMRTFPYYNNQEKAWRNSIRYNLSINECFIKNGRAENGKGNYWSIHPACVEDFAKGDYRRRQARRRARKGAKCVNRSQFPTNEIQSNTGYVPMTPSPFAYPAMMSSFFGYQPITSSPVGYRPMTSSPALYQSTTSNCSPRAFQSSQGRVYSSPALTCQSTALPPQQHSSYQNSPPPQCNVGSDAVLFPRPGTTTTLPTESRFLAIH